MAADARHFSEAQALRKCALFAPLDEASRQILAERSHRRRFPAGAHIFRFGEPGQSMMAILAGMVRVSRPTAKGKEIILADLSPGEIIGEIAVLDGNDRSADAVALTNVELMVLDRRDILTFLEQNPRLCLELIALLCARLRLADERMVDVGFVDLPARLAKTLLRHAPTPRAPDYLSKLSLSQTEIAEMIGGTRESVNRHLQQMQKAGVLQLRDGWIVVVKHDALATLAERD